jgi:hypothetical protein
MRKSPRKNHSASLSLDSLIDVFMNILGILIIAAITIAILPQEEADTDSPSKQAEQSPKKKKVVTEKPVATVYLASQENVNTIPFYVYLDSEGARPIDLLNQSSLSRYFSIEYVGESTKLKALPGAVWNEKQRKLDLGQISGLERHIFMLVKPNGVRHYKDVRSSANLLGIRSGWSSFEDSHIYFGPGGRSMNTVQ